MTAEPSRLPMPPRTTTEDGAPRRVGVEIELIDLDVPTTAGVLAGALGGEVRTISDYEAEVHGDAAGPWRVELDFAYLKQRGREPAGDGSILGELLEGVVRAGAEAVVPVEVVSPPLPMDQLQRVERLVDALRATGALGTRAGLTYAFGMQLNPEVPARDAGTLLAYLRAFLCLYDWLLRACRVDLTRRLTGYSAPFGEGYARRVVDPGYAPDLPALIDDYLRDNPTRNRALDMLPLFTELDEPRVRAVVDDPRVKARPALHYRLPNCEIDDPDWNVGVAWGRWLQVEQLACDDARLRQACAAYADVLDGRVELPHDWADESERWLTPPVLP